MFAPLAGGCFDLLNIAAAMNYHIETHDDTIMR